MSTFPGFPGFLHIAASQVLLSFLLSSALSNPQDVHLMLWCPTSGRAVYRGPGKYFTICQIKLLYLHSSYFYVRFSFCFTLVLQLFLAQSSAKHICSAYILTIQSYKFKNLLFVSRGGDGPFSSMFSQSCTEVLCRFNLSSPLYSPHWIPPLLKFFQNICIKL